MYGQWLPLEPMDLHGSRSASTRAPMRQRSMHAPEPAPGLGPDRKPYQSNWRSCTGPGGHIPATTDRPRNGPVSGLRRTSNSTAAMPGLAPANGFDPHKKPLLESSRGSILNLCMDSGYHWSQWICTVGAAPRRGRLCASGACTHLNLHQGLVLTENSRPGPHRLHRSPVRGQLL